MTHSPLNKETILAKVRTMAKVTSKLQVTVPKAIAEQFGIRPGSEITWAAAGDAIRIVPPGLRRRALSRDARLALFDEATERQQQRNAERRQAEVARDRGWTRDELYERGRPR
jgi:AbrB family looped-hinge helix DNA binding protein